MKLMQGDCLEQMRDIAPNSVDMVLTDPPYSSGGTFTGDRQASTKEKYCDSKYNGAARFQSFSGDNMDQRSFTEFMRMVMARAREKAKPGAIAAVFIDWRNIAWASNGKLLVDWTPGFKALPGCYSVSSVPPRQKHHQTEKPVELLAHLLGICPEGGTVLDPFMGSGSTAVACVNTGRDFIGMELDQGYFETAQRRVKEAQEGRGERGPAG